MIEPGMATAAISVERQECMNNSTTAVASRLPRITQATALSRSIEWMVVIPTANEVELSYGLTNIDYASYAVTLLGVIGLFVLWRRGQVVYPDRVDPWAAYPPDLDPFAADRPYVYEAVVPLGAVIADQPSSSSSFDSFDSFDFDDRRSNRPGGAATTTDEIGRAHV